MRGKGEREVAKGNRGTGKWRLKQGKETGKRAKGLGNKMGAGTQTLTRAQKEKSIQQHMAIAHPTSNATKCKMCPFIGLTIEDLKKHNMSTHLSHEANRNLTHACDQCPFKTFKTSALNIHKLLKHANPSKIMNMNNVPQKPSNI